MSEKTMTRPGTLRATTEEFPYTEQRDSQHRHQEGVHSETNEAIEVSRPLCHTKTKTMSAAYSV